MSSISIAWIIGLIVGISIAVFIAIFILLRFVNKDGKIKTEYDERQQIVRGKAYRLAFFVTIISNAALMIIATEGNFLKLGYPLFCIPIFAGVIAQVSYCIFCDGYVGLNTNMSRFFIVMILISALNFGLAINAIVRGEMLKDGVLNSSFANLMCGILFIVLSVELIIKKIIDAREEQIA